MASDRGVDRVAEPRRSQERRWPTRRALIAAWAAAAVGLGFVLAAASPRGPLDDPDPARQRPGFLDGGGLPAPAPDIGGEIPVPGRRAVVFFVRPQQIAALCRDLAGNSLAHRASLAVVVSSSATCPASAVLVVDRGALAQRFGMPSPHDRGPPVGYAVVDATGRVRYRTLDPDVAGHLDEVAAILGAVG